MKKRIVTHVVPVTLPVGKPGTVLPVELVFLTQEEGALASTQYFVGHDQEASGFMKLFKKLQMLEEIPRRSEACITDDESVYVNLHGSIIIAKKSNPIGDDDARVIGRFSQGKFGAIKD